MIKYFRSTEVLLRILQVLGMEEVSRTLGLGVKSVDPQGTTYGEGSLLGHLRQSVDES